MPNPYQEYKKQAVMTMTEGEAVVKLFDECIRMIHIGIQYINEKNIEKTNQTLKKAHAILNYLRSILNMDYEISHNLSLLYDFYVRKIINANIKKDAKELEEILPMIMDLRNSFFEAEKLVKGK